MAKTKKSTSIDTDEIGKFSKQKQDWWDVNGSWKALHKINDARLEYIYKAIEKHKPLREISILDIGCGGGLISEPLAKSGGKVIGIDVSQEIINAAKNHAKKEKLAIRYECISVEEFSKKNHKSKYDVILLMDVLEHTNNISSLFSSIHKLLKTDGIILISTLNRTMYSLVFGVLCAEHLLKWLPTGMHDWDKFIQPFELSSLSNKSGFKISDISGITYNLVRSQFLLTPHNLKINYILTACKK